LKNVGQRAHEFVSCLVRFGSQAITGLSLHSSQRDL
jgi:hypothetical protein